MVNDVYGAPFVKGHRYWKWMPFMPNSRPGVKIGQIEDDDDLEKMKENNLEKETETKYEDYEEVKEEKEIQKEESLHEEKIENLENIPETKDVPETENIPETEDVKVQSGLSDECSVEPVEEPPIYQSEETEDETSDL